MKAKQILWAAEEYTARAVMFSLSLLYTACFYSYHIGLYRCTQLALLVCPTKRVRAYAWRRFTIGDGS